MSYNCNKDALSLPISECDDCSQYEKKIKDLEELVSSMGDTVTELQTTINNLTVDTALSSTSTNPVQNKAINEEINDIWTGIGNKQDELFAGHGIRIDNNIISATGSEVPILSLTYEEGESGLVLTTPLSEIYDFISQNQGRLCYLENYLQDGEIHSILTMGGEDTSNMWITFFVGGPHNLDLNSLEVASGNITHLSHVIFDDRNS